MSSIEGVKVFSHLSKDPTFAAREVNREVEDFLKGKTVIVMNVRETAVYPVVINDNSSGSMIQVTKFMATISFHVEYFEESEDGENQ